MRNALPQLKKKILFEYLDKNPKAFWSYVSNIQGNAQTVRSLKNECGNVINDEKEKANIVNNFLQSVFTSNNTLGSLPQARSEGIDAENILLRG